MQQRNFWTKRIECWKDWVTAMFDKFSKISHLQSVNWKSEAVLSEPVRFRCETKHLKAVVHGKKDRLRTKSLMDWPTCLRSGYQFNKFVADPAEACYPRRYNFQEWQWVDEASDHNKLFDQWKRKITTVVEVTRFKIPVRTQVLRDYESEKLTQKDTQAGVKVDFFFGLGFKASRKWTFHKSARITGRKMGSWFFWKTNYMLKIACSFSFQIIMKCFRRNYRKWNSSQPIHRLLPSKSTFLVQLQCRVARICRWFFPLSIACSNWKKKSKKTSGSTVWKACHLKLINFSIIVKRANQREANSKQR